MTHQVTGTVAGLTVRNLMSKAGKAFTKHGVKLADGREFELDGFKQRYRVGDEVAGLSVALKYKVWTEIGGYNPSAPPMPGTSSSGPSPTPTSYDRGGSGKDVGFPIPQGSYQTSIIRQNALTNAASLINAAFGLSDGDTPTAELEAAVSRRAELAMKIAYKFAAFSSGQLDTVAAEEMAREIKGLVAKGTLKDAA